MNDRQLTTRKALKVSQCGLTDYVQTWECMRSFTDDRDESSADELWLTEHHPVYTLGQSGKTEAFLLEPDIPIVHSDRGGRVTYHGPGQIVGYVMVDLKRAGLSVHAFVELLEESMIATLADYGVHAERLKGNPGVYANGRKIGSLGLRVRRGCTFHGISLNVDMNLEPFDAIDPCGIPGMNVTQLSEFNANVQFDEVAEKFATTLNLLWCSG